MRWINSPREMWIIIVTATFGKICLQIRGCLYIFALLQRSSRRDIWGSWRFLSRRPAARCMAFGEFFAGRCLHSVGHISGGCNISGPIGVLWGGRRWEIRMGFDKNGKLLQASCERWSNLAIYSFEKERRTTVKGFLHNFYISKSNKSDKHSIWWVRWKGTGVLYTTR